MEKFEYSFSFGPWNIHEGADPFGPPVRSSLSLDQKLPLYKEMGFDFVQFHDDDVVPDLEELSAAQIAAKARKVGEQLAAAGLRAEFVAPRLWEDPRGIDGAYTANDPKNRSWAIERSKKCIDIANELDTNFMVMWLAREGTYLREAKDAVKATSLLIEAINQLLRYDRKLRIAIEPKPNEPMDLAYIPTIGHGLALGMQSVDPKRVGVLMESAHAILAGLDPADEISFAMAFGKLWSVHLNDQNGLKFDQDRSFGSVDLRRAFNQVRVLDNNQFYDIGTIGLDVKALRTQSSELATKHLRNSLRTFLKLVEIVRGLDRKQIDQLIADQDYEELDWLILTSLMGS